MRRRAPQHFYAFDLLWIDGEDLRERPLLERKLLLEHRAGAGAIRGPRRQRGCRSVRCRLCQRHGGDRREAR